MISKICALQAVLDGHKVRYENWAHGCYVYLNTKKNIVDDDGERFDFNDYPDWTFWEIVKGDNI